MIGHRAVIGLSLLSALLFCAFAAQSASAAPAKNTTAFTCVSTGGSTNKDFSDEHCDTQVTPGTGKFEHKAIGNVTTKVVASNETTAGKTANAVLTGKLFGVSVKITCTKGSSTGELTNTEKEKEHKLTGKATTTLTGCSVNEPSSCGIAEPIVVEANAEGVEGLGAGKNEMGIEFKPASGTTFVTLVMTGFCFGNHKVEGTAIATGGTGTQTGKHGGATLVFTKAMTKETLKFAGEPAEYEATKTVRMAEKEAPVSVTTVT